MIHLRLTISQTCGSVYIRCTFRDEWRNGKQDWKEWEMIEQQVIGAVRFLLFLFEQYVTTQLVPYLDQQRDLQVATL